MSELMQKKIELDPTGQFVTLVLPVDEARLLRVLLNSVHASLFQDEQELRDGLIYDLTETLSPRT